jgi:methionyl-tRNA formyltransferase
MSRSPVALAADEAGIPVLQPTTLRDESAIAQLRSLAPDLCPVVAYGALIREPALSLPPRGWVNLHFSLLPAWRGAAPVQHAIWNGDDLTGASTFRIDEGMDTGPVFGTMTEAIAPDDTSGELLQRLARSGAGLLVATVDGIDSGDLVAVPQSGEGVSSAPKISVDDARISWDRPALAVDRQVRACTPAPGAWTMLREARVKIGPVSRTTEHAPVGVLTPAGRNRWIVGTATEAVELGDVQPAGKRAMPVADWLRGLHLESDESFQ